MRFLDPEGDLTHKMNRNPITLSLGLAAATVVGVGQIPLSSFTSGLYTQDFDTLAASGGPFTWTDNSTLPGWYLSRVTYLTGTGSGTAGGAYSFGTSSSTDRALGSVATALPSGTGDIAYGLRLRNDTAGSFTGFEFAYVGEQWRRANNANSHKLQFSYKISGSPINLLDTGFSSVTQLDFTGPISGSSATALNGNLSANRTALSFSLNFTSPFVSLDPGEEIMLRWIDENDSGADHGLAIDNLSITIPEIPAFLPVVVTIGVGALWTMRRRVR